MTLEYSIKRKESLKYSASLMKCPKLLNQIYAVGYKIAPADWIQHFLHHILILKSNIELLKHCMYASFERRKMN